MELALHRGRRAVVRLAFLGACALSMMVYGAGLAGCGARVCEPGETKSCACKGGGSGVQTCSAQGSRWQACDCAGVAATATAAPAAVAASAPSGPQITPPVQRAGESASNPELAPDDAGFTDTKNGWGWSDRCWKSLQAGLLGYAKAQCQRGLDVAPNPGPPKGARPSLLYNMGLIEERGGNKALAKSLFEQSLALRPHPDVEAALRRVGGEPPKPQTREEKAASCARACPGGAGGHCYCACMGECD